MTDRSARGTVTHGPLPLVFALVVLTGCAQDSAPQPAAPPVANRSVTAIKSGREHVAPAPLTSWTRLTADNVRLASAIDASGDKSASADSSRRSRLSQLADALNSPDGTDASSQVSVDDNTGPASTPTFIPGRPQPNPIFNLNPTDIAATPKSLESSDSVAAKTAAPTTELEKETKKNSEPITAQPIETAEQPKVEPQKAASRQVAEAPPAAVTSSHANVVPNEIAATPAPQKHFEPVPTPAPAKPAEVSPSLATAEPPQLATPNALLPWGPSKVSPEMAAICARAEEAARQGFNLAERGAMYSARAQFIDSLCIVTQALDAQHNTNAHARALNAGLRALQEVNDFVPRTGELEADLNFRLLIDSHRTPVLKDYPLDHLTALQSQRMYLSYAQEQLAAAGEDQPVASLALHGLGKICTVPAQMHGPPEQIAEAKAVVYHQAALLVEPKNFMAANELGVLLAHFGRLPEARSALEHAVAVSGGPTEWQNLAVVCDRMNDPSRAAKARQQALVAANRLQTAGYGTAGMKFPIQWLDPESFSTTNSMIADAAPASSTTLTSVMAKNASPDSAAPAGNAPAVAAKPSKAGFWSWLK